MPLRPAEKQRRYRENKKNHDPNYLAKEAARKRKNYVPSADQHDHKKRSRRERERINQSLCYYRKKTTTTEFVRKEGTTTRSKILKVKLNFPVKTKSRPTAAKKINKEKTTKFGSLALPSAI